MRLINTIYRDDAADPSGPVLERPAVRAIINRNGLLLMVHSSVNGDYLFPGGGVEQGENHEQALKREVREECGIATADCLVSGAWGKVIELSIPREPEYSAFQITSHYYLCQVGEQTLALALESHEQNLGYHPVWVEPKQALTANLRQIETGQAGVWTRREAVVLETLLDEGI